MNIFANMKIGARLAFGFGVVLVLSIIIAAIGAWQLSAIATASRAMMELPIKKERMVSDWASYISSGIVRITAIAKSEDSSLAPFFASHAAESSRLSMEVIKKLEPLLTSKDEKDLYARVLVNRKIYVDARDGVMKLKSAGQMEEAAQLFEKTYVPAAQGYEKMVKEFIELQRRQLDAEAANIDVIEASSRRQLVLLATLVLAFGLLCAWRLTVGITRPLKGAVDVARRVAAGDLTVRISSDSRDECGQLLTALREMNDGLARIVSQVRTGAGFITAASGEIAAGNQDLSSRTEQQASSLEETASSMEELTSTVRQNSDNAQQANHLAQSASEVATKGGAVVEQVVDTMGAINQSARKIVDIIGVIDGIAFQTNILALNAAVEAARAGEQGRGFAVVASEVRTLAQRSAAAAKEIKTLINDSVEKVETGSRLVDEAGGTMHEIVDSIRRVTDIMGGITSASREQTVGIEQINEAIAQMEQATQQNASLVEEAAAAAESLNTQAGKLSEQVALFKLDATQSIAAPAKAALPVRVAAASGAKAMQRLTGKEAHGDEWEQF